MIFPSQYICLEDKRQFVEDETPPGDSFTFTEVHDKLDKLQKQGFVFRGQRNALWPIVSSAQREYIERRKKGKVTDFRLFLKGALEWAKKETLFMPKCQDYSGRPLYDHEIWGWLQHYQYFTPYIDFTSNYLVALYMATASAQPIDTNDDGYFSIYAFDGRESPSQHEPCRLENVIKNHQDILSKCGDNEEEMFAFRTWINFTFLLVHKDGSLKPWDETLARERIASQGGLFVYFNNPYLSLEEHCWKQNKMNEGENGDGCILKRIKCIDIPNNMIPLVREYCVRQGVTEESLGLKDQRIDTCLKCIGARFKW